MDNKLERKEVGDVAVFGKPTQIAPGVTRKKMSQTIVPKDSEQDTELTTENVPENNRFTSLLKNTNKGEM